jgi:hypothetical protein
MGCDSIRSSARGWNFFGARWRLLGYASLPRVSGAMSTMLASSSNSNFSGSGVDLHFFQLTATSVWIGFDTCFPSRNFNFRTKTLVFIGLT